VPVRLRALHDDGPGQWLRGALRLAPGSLLWEPDEGISADPLELAAAWAAPASGRRGPDMATHVEQPAGRFSGTRPDLFQMSQELVARRPGAPGHQLSRRSPPGLARATTLMNVTGGDDGLRWDAFVTAMLGKRGVRAPLPYARFLFIEAWDAYLEAPGVIDLRITRQGGHGQSVYGGDPAVRNDRSRRDW
jgi:hypothetical protein